MKTLLGPILAGGLFLAFSSPSHAQMNVQFGRGGSPTVTFGQPAYGQYPSAGYGQYPAGQPVYGQPYAQPSYYPPTTPGYAPRSYSSGYSGYATPANRQGYYQPSYAPSYQAPYQQQPGYSPYIQPPSGTGVMINGRMYSLPR
ncbi:hypothetical protein V5E97_03345 [Singulisphaera sp. Ch08]|uniref:Uncharacterized protein n=1 Tax=Singulisphaera sp. Ch08 TaxID=3120278 RepID=A0AAU7CJ80_9BACT